MSLRRLFTVVALVGVLAAPVFAQQQVMDAAEYDAAMKQVFSTVRATGGHIESEAGADVAASGTTLAELFEKVGTFWEARQAAEAAELSATALQAAQQLAEAGESGDFEAAGEAFSSLRGTCMPCHATYRERDAEGNWQIKSGGDTNPRFGVWKLQSNAPPPSSNVMTYEPWGDGGMKITVASTNREGRESAWSYTTMFDGVFRPVEGQQNAETSVEIIDERSTRISNKRNGRVSQVIINTLSEDGNTINNEYVRMDTDGKIVRVTHAVYERIK